MKYSFILIAVIFSWPVSLMAQWSQTNGPYGGSIESFAVCGKMLFAKVWCDSIYHSTNRGNTWTRVTAPFSSFGDVIECGKNLFAIGDSGVYVSADSGQTWSPTGLIGSYGNTRYINTLVASGVNLFAGQAFGRIYISTNGGINWKLINSGLPQDFDCGKLATSGSDLYAFGDWWASIHDNIPHHSIFRSTDNGTSWEATAFKGSNISSRSLSLAASGSNIYAGAYAGIYVSTDRGISWAYHNFSDGGWTKSLVVDDNNIFAGIGLPYDTKSSVGVYRSIDNGTHWVKMCSGLSNTVVSGLGFSGKDIFVSTYGGIFSSADYGSNWMAVNTGPGYMNIIHLAVSGSNLIVGTVNNGLVYSADSGKSWIQTEVKDITVCALAASGNSVFAGTYGEGLFVSTNGGLAWNKVTYCPAYIFALAVSGTIIYAGGYSSGVFLSTDNGTTWEKTGSELENITIRSLAVADPIIFAGTDGGIIISSNKGRNWRTVDTPFSKFTDLVKTGSNIFASTDSGVFLSVDKGISWAAVNSGLTNISVSALVLVGNNLFAGTCDGGVFLSTDQGTGWAAVNTGLEHSDVTALAVLNVNLVACTWKKGIWQRPLSEMIEIVDNHPLHIPAEYLISQNYPNPFNPGTRIDYSIPRQSHVTLKIFDILGREIATLADEIQEAGNKSIGFDGATLTSGVYFYRIVADNFTETKKMILAK